MSRGAAVARGGYSRNLGYLLIALVAFVSAIGMLAASPKRALADENLGYICVYNGPASYYLQSLTSENVKSGEALVAWVNGTQPNNLIPSTVADAIYAATGLQVGTHVDPWEPYDLTLVTTYGNGCQYPSSTATPTPTPTATAVVVPTATPVLISEDTPPPLTGLDTESTPPPTDLASQTAGGSNVALGLALLVLAGILAAAGLLLPKAAKR